MILLIDWGNTFLKYLFIDSSLDSSIDMESQLIFDNLSQTDSLTSLTSEISTYIVKNKISSSFISSVRKSSDNKQLSSLLDKLNIDSNFVKTEQKFNSISSAYKSFENLGIDRWLNIIAGHNSKKITGIIDIGSAITLDVVSKNGQHLGGQIVPGNRLLLNSIKTTDRVFVSERLIDKDDQLLGISTNECVKFGVNQMIQGYLENSISEVTRHYQVEQWIFTGGGGEYWSEKMSVSKNKHYTYDRLLVFKGLIKYLNR